MPKIIKIAIVSRYIGFIILAYALFNIPMYIIGYYQQYVISCISWSFPETLPVLLGWLKYIMSLVLDGLLFIAGSQFILLVLKKRPFLWMKK